MCIAYIYYIISSLPKKKKKKKYEQPRKKRSEDALPSSIKELLYLFTPWINKEDKKPSSLEPESETHRMGEEVNEANLSFHLILLSRLNQIQERRHASPFFTVSQLLLWNLI